MLILILVALLVKLVVKYLLDDENKVNIGYLTYCTDKDVSSDNNRRKIAPNETISFDIAVTKRYFPTDNDKDNGPSKVKYISIMDDNPYCTVGGYSKYLGLSHDEIVGGLVTRRYENYCFNINILNSIIIYSRYYFKCFT